MATSASDDDESDAFSVYEEWDDLECTTPPIVVGYVFGPKKMSTMGVVMAEASRTRLTSSAVLLRQANLRKSAANSVVSEPSLTPDALRDYQSSPSGKTPTTKNQVEIILDAGHDLRKVVRRLQSSSSSVADSTTTSTGTRTASTVSHLTNGTPTTGNLYSSSATALSNTNNTGSKRQSSSLASPSQHQIPIRVSFVPLDPEIPLEEQHGGRMDVILHKLTEDILLSSQWEQKKQQMPEARQGNHDEPRERQEPSSIDKETTPQPTPDDPAHAAAARRIQRLCEFSARHECPLVDNPHDVQRLMNRAEIAQTLQTCLQGVQSASGRKVAAPKYAVLSPSSPEAHQVLQQAELRFPLMVKPLTAAGTKASHAMAVLLRPDALDGASTASWNRMPSLCQEYVNHNAWLYKVYVLGDFCSVHKRRSLPNLPTGSTADPSGDICTITSTKSVVAFDSQRPYPRLRDFGYDRATLANMTHALSTDTTPVTAEEILPIVHALKQAFHLELFGFDIICASDTDTLMVVDVNYFPSYKEVPNFAALLAQYLTDRALERRLSQAASGGSL